MSYTKEEVIGLFNEFGSVCKDANYKPLPIELFLMAKGLIDTKKKPCGCQDYDPSIQHGVFFCVECSPLFKKFKEENKRNRID